MHHTETAISTKFYRVQNKHFLFFTQSWQVSDDEYLHWSDPDSWRLINNFRSAEETFSTWFFTFWWNLTLYRQISTKIRNVSSRWRAKRQSLSYLFRVTRWRIVFVPISDGLYITISHRFCCFNHAFWLWTSKFKAKKFALPSRRHSDHRSIELRCF